MDDGDLMCRPIAVLPFLQELDVANARVGGERNPLKTEVIYCVNDLDAATPEWKIGDVRSLAKTPAFTAGSIAFGIAVGSPQFIMHQLLSKADVIRAMHERIRRQSSPSFQKVWASSVSTASCGFTATKILEEQRAAAVYDEIGQRSLERLFPGLTEDSMTQATLSGGQSRIGSLLLHTCEPSLSPKRASRQRSEARSGQAFSQRRSWRRPSPRSSRQPPPPISSHSTTMSRPRRSCMSRRSKRQRTSLGNTLSRDSRDRVSQTRPLHPRNTPGPPLKRRAAMTWTSRRPGRAVPVGRSSKRSCHDSLVGLVSDA